MQENFVPKVGMRCKSSYFRGVTDIEYIDLSGMIEYIGTNFFQLRLSNRDVLIIKDKYYWAIDPLKFYDEKGK